VHGYATAERAPLSRTRATVRLSAATGSKPLLRCSTVCALGLSSRTREPNARLLCRDDHPQGHRQLMLWRETNTFIRSYSEHPAPPPPVWASRASRVAALAPTTAAQPFSRRFVGRPRWGVSLVPSIQLSRDVMAGMSCTRDSYSARPPEAENAASRGLDHMASTLERVMCPVGILPVD
jgi:hypothetical protein